MSTHLWRYYFEDDIDSFQQLLACATFNGASNRASSASGPSTSGGSPGRALSTLSPFTKTKQKSASGRAGSLKAGRSLGPSVLTRAEVNWKDSHGVTLLHRIASSTTPRATQFALALLEVPVLDLYCQDHESGWTALHRALYAGNASIARALMDRDMRDFTGAGAGSHAGGLIKIKDREGNSPFDVYAATIAARILASAPSQATLPAAATHDDDEDTGSVDAADIFDGGHRRNSRAMGDVDGDELFVFGSNKNLNLGFGDGDDRQFPERVYLKRPEYLQELLYREHVARNTRTPLSKDSVTAINLDQGAIPALVDYKPIKIQDVQLSKLHTAILTTDSEANLYICGFGPGGRLGTGDESTRFRYTSILSGGLHHRKITSIGLGQNHTLAVSSQGEVFSWGNNTFGQLGYNLATTSNDEEPAQLFPRQIFGPLKRETVMGCAASRTHSIVFTANSLYTFGKNDGQLGLVDSDARLLESQTTPRKVGASLFFSPISMASAIERATICLLENHDVWVFANYGYARVVFPLDDGFNSSSIGFFAPRFDRPNHIVKVRAGGETICALSNSGEVFAINVSQKLEPSAEATSTTNPTKIRGALSIPQRIWSLRKSHLAVRDVDVGQNGSVIICTNSGSVWKRVERAKIQDPRPLSKKSEHKSKDYKFLRIPGLTRISAVRSNAFGTFAAVRSDCDVLRTQIAVASKTLWQDIFPLLAFHDLTPYEDSETESPTPRLWKARRNLPDPSRIRRAVLSSKDVEGDLQATFRIGESIEGSGYDIKIGSTVSDLRIPCHEFLLRGRSSVLRKGLRVFESSYFFEVPGVLTIEYDNAGDILVLFEGIDVLTLIDIVLYLYSDNIVGVWNFARHAPELAVRYRQIRTEVMKTAAQLDLRELERAARLITEPNMKLHQDLDMAILEEEFTEGADTEIQLSDGTMKAHRALICRRCPFFDGLFHGRAGGGWLSARRKDVQESREAIKVDLQHVSKQTFDLVLRHLYSDAGEEIFEESVASDLDEFLDLILDVMAIANELMIDRLAQICQKVLGGFVNTQNVCQLLNAVAPCSITEFKDAALEYICLNLEGMLENHRLEELEEELMVELDQVVRDNQLACLPFAKSGRAEAELLERHPELVELMAKAKRVKLDSIGLQSRIFDDSPKSSKASKSPLLKPKRSAHELMFDMDEDEAELVSRTKAMSTNEQKKVNPNHEFEPRSPQASLPKEELWFDAKGKALSPVSPAMTPGSVSGGFTFATPSPRQKNASDGGAPKQWHVSGGTPWSASSLKTSKLDMKEIMAQASESRHSNISAAFSQPGQTAEAVKVHPKGKVSQRERKKQLLQIQLQQQQQEQENHQFSSIGDNKSSANITMPKPSPWRTPPAGPKISLKDELSSSKDNSWSPVSGKRSRASTPSLTMRQTVSGMNVSIRKSSLPGSTSADQPIQQRSVSSPALQNRPSSSDGPSVQRPKPSQAKPKTHAPSSTVVPSVSPRSVQHKLQTGTVEPSLQLSMADILAMQQTEKDLIKEATAKRSLQEIQEEQAFQEWWDQEEAATRARMEAEAAAAAAAITNKSKASSSRSARSGAGASSSSKGGRGGSSRGGSSAPSRGRGRGGRGGGGGGSRNGRETGASNAEAETETAGRKR